MRILVVATSPVLPATYGGRVRTHRLALALARAGATVDVVAPWAPGGPRHPVRLGGARFHPHFLPANALALLFRDRLVPSMVSHSWQPFAMGPAQLLRPFAGYDVVQFEHVARAGWMERAPGRLKVYSAHNVELDFLAAQPEDGTLRGPMLRAVERLEREAVRASDLVVTCTDSDAARMRELYGAPRGVAVIPNGYDSTSSSEARPGTAAARAALGVPEHAQVLLFVGSASRLNLQATEFMVRKVLPHLPANVHLLLVGDCGPATPRDGEPPGRVHRPGRLSDLQLAFGAADVAVNPMLSGSGSNVKLAEYLASGLPVVTTPVGLRGFEQHSAGVTVSAPHRFADALAAVDGTRPRHDRLDELSWTHLGRRLHGIYAQRLRVLDGAARGAA